MELPFELVKKHKSITKYSWKRKGLITTKEEFEAIYNKYIYATNCDLCDTQFKNTMERHMEHDHKNGEFRNIVCRSCNMLKFDVKLKCLNTSGYKGINKKIDKTCNQGFVWNFTVCINGKRTYIKSSVDKEKLIEFADKWKKDNNYNT